MMHFDLHDGDGGDDDDEGDAAGYDDDHFAGFEGTYRNISHP